MRKQIIIIGAGASGLVAGIFAAQGGCQVTILEHGPKAGKKILSTGNGKCNITNYYMDSGCYRSDTPEFPMSVIHRFDTAEVLGFFNGIGVVTKDRNGYLYPASEQAASVLDALCWEAERLQIHIRYQCETQSIKREKGQFLISTNQGLLSCDKLILATGSKAAPKTGSDGSGYELAKALGHHLIKPLPALVQLRCKEKWYKQVSGVRVEALVKLMVDKKEVSRDQGEVQLTDYGISGIPVFQISRFAVRALDQKHKVSAVLDFLPHLKDSQLLTMLQERRQQLGYRMTENFLTGFFNQKLSLALLNLAGIEKGQKVLAISDKQLKALSEKMKGLITEVIDFNSFDQAQVCQGGVDVGEINPETMESKLVKQLYLVGELLDVDGICGGYNLHWAFASGALAGKDVAGNDKNQSA